MLESLFENHRVIRVGKDHEDHQAQPSHLGGRFRTGSSGQGQLVLGIGLGLNRRTLIWGRLRAVVMHESPNELLMLKILSRAVRWDTL